MAILNLPIPSHGPNHVPHFPMTGGLTAGPPTVADSDNGASAYQQSSDVEVRYSPQSNGVTRPVDTVVTGPTRVLESSQQLLEGWRTAAGAEPAENSGPFGAALQTATQSEPALLSQVENDVVQVNHSSREPLVYLDDGELEGDPSITSPFVTANQVHNTVENDLGRDVRYRSEDGRLNINVDTPGRQPNESPYHTPDSGTLTFPDSGTGQNLAIDPDVVAHEQGHAILNSQRPEIDFSPESKATHEGFSDGVAFFQSLQQDEVRADTIRRWDNPEESQSGLASNISEAGARYFGNTEAEQTDGLRDLSEAPPTGSVDAHGHHTDSQKFSTALHDSTRDLYQQIRRDNPDLSSEDAFDQATDRVRSDFYRSLDFLPPGGQVTQDDLGQAMMRANGVDNGGGEQALYRRNLEESGLRPVTGDNVAHEAGLRAVGENMNLPEGLAGGNFESGVDGEDSPVRRQATEFIEQHGARLGIPQDYQMDPSRVYSNDRGETFMIFRGQREGGTPSDPTELLGVGFNQEGELIHLDSAQREGLRMPSFGPPGGSTPGQFPIPFPTPGGHLPGQLPGTGGPLPGHGPTPGSSWPPSGGSTTPGSDSPAPSGGNSLPPSGWFPGGVLPPFGGTQNGSQGGTTHPQPNGNSSH